MKRLAVAIAVMVVAFYTSASGSDATKINNGAKLLLKEGTDSLFYTYNDNGTVKYAYSEGGGSWSRVTVATSHDNPAIAADSTGKRWIVAHKPPAGNQNTLQELYWFGGSWLSQTLYSTSGSNTLGPASLAGASSTTTGIVYAAFLVTTSGGTYYVVLTKFNGTTVAACTLATAYPEHLGDPAVAVEPYKADSDRVYVAWENPIHEIKYAMDVDGRSSGIANMWTWSDPLSDPMATAGHPCINADRGRVVVAWEQGSTAPDIYARTCSSGTWQTAKNLSNTANYASNWPTIAMGDTIVVAWEETYSVSDHDIYACINLDANKIRNIADDDAISTFPHVVFQNKASGGTFRHYVHTIWSEADTVCYNKLELTGLLKTQQCAASVSLTTKPSLAACLPNPFHGRTQISYALPAASNVSLQVYDATGRPVRTLASGFQKAGIHSVSWDARDTDGKQVPYGVYFYRLDAQGFLSAKQAVVTR